MNKKVASISKRWAFERQKDIVQLLEDKSNLERTIESTERALKVNNGFMFTKDLIELKKCLKQWQEELGFIEHLLQLYEREDI